jgi:hypothetical protein
MTRPLFAKGLNKMPWGFKVSRMPIANMIAFVNIYNFFKWKNIYIVTFGVAHCGTLDDSLAF